MELAQATEALLEALKQTDEYARYEAARQAVAANADELALFKRYQRAQAAVQMAAIGGGEPRAEDAAQFEALGALVYASDALSECVLRQMRVQQLVAETMERITRAVGLDVELPEC